MCLPKSSPDTKTELDNHPDIDIADLLRAEGYGVVEGAEATLAKIYELGMLPKKGNKMETTQNLAAETPLTPEQLEKLFELSPLDQVVITDDAADPSEEDLVSEPL